MMDKEITMKLRKCLVGYDLKFVEQLRQFLKLLERNNIPIEDVYKYADDVHRIRMSMVEAEIGVFNNIFDILPPCPKCGHSLELIGISNTGDKIPNNLHGYKYMYYCDSCLYEKFYKDRTFQEEFERLQKLSKEKE